MRDKFVVAVWDFPTWLEIFFFFLKLVCAEFKEEISAKKLSQAKLRGFDSILLTNFLFQ